MDTANQVSATIAAIPAKTKEQIDAETAAVHASIKANFDNTIDVIDVKFHFKTVKDETTKVETKRPTVALSIPVPSVEGIVKSIETGGKALELLVEVVRDMVIARAREIINDNENITQENFPLESLAWEAIAALPKAERRGGGISKEVWEEFSKDYIAVMPGVTGKTAEQIGNAAKILLNKFNQVKTNKPVLKLLSAQLGLYTANSPQAESFTECVQFLMDKADSLLNMDEAALLANL